MGLPRLSAGLQLAPETPGTSEAVWRIPASQFSLSDGFLMIFFYLWSKSGFLGNGQGELTLPGSERRKIHTSSAAANSFPVTYCSPLSIQVPLGGHPISHPMRQIWGAAGGDGAEEKAGSGFGACSTVCHSAKSLCHLLAGGGGRWTLGCRALSAQREKCLSQLCSWGPAN